MNGILNIQVRMLTADAQNRLRQLQKEIAALDKQFEGQSATAKNLAYALEHAKNETARLAAANKELAASQRAVSAATKASAGAADAVTKAQLALEKATLKAAQAERSRDAVAQGSLAHQAKEVAATEALVRAKEQLIKATNSAATAEERYLAAEAAANVSDPSEAAIQREIVELRKLEAALIEVDRAKRALANQDALSVTQMAKAAGAAAALAKKEEELAAAQLAARNAGESLASARAAVDAAETEGASAAVRLAAAEREVAAADELAAIAARAVTEARVAQSAATAAATTAAKEAAAIQRAATAETAAAAAASSAAAGGGFAAAATTMRKFGSQTQWAGRQLSTNFTMPVVLAGGLATKFALDNEKAMTRVRKVYGELTFDPAQVAAYKAEVDELGKSFLLLSNYFGVAQKDVINIAADWAAAGSSGRGLAESVKNTLTTMVLGEIDAAEATKALIAIQAQYNLSTAELSDTIGMLNIVENQTGASLSDLITGFSRAAGMANLVGVDTRHLAAMIAALTPAAGSAANAGNALKTVFARLVAPTKEAKDILHAVGLETDQTAWKNANATEKLEALNKKFYQYGKAQRGVIAQTLAGTYQVSRFAELMDSMHGNLKNGVGQLSQYEKALRATADSNAYMAQKERELQIVLQSNPQKMKQVWVVLQNTLARAIIPAIPTIIMLAGVIQQLFDKFNSLPPYVRKAVVGFILFAAIMGPVLRILGSFMLLGGYVIKMVMGLGKAIVFLGTILRVALLEPLIAIVAAIGLPELAVIAAVAAIIAAFLLIPGAADNVVKGVQAAFNALPQGVQNAMMAVVKVVYSAVMAVYKLFSYLNPFAHHSPSLVENVTNGMAVVKSEFASITDIHAPIMKAYADIKLFKNATAELSQGLDKLSRVQDLEELTKLAPGAVDEFKALVRDIQVLTPLMEKYEAQMKSQQAVVDLWEKKVNDANDALDIQKDKLQALKDVAEGYSKLLSQANDDLDKFANAPLVGMRAMEDQIFANEQAQKQLRLEMMNLEDVTGPMDDLQDRLAKLAGGIEVLRGEQTDLRNAGAGSDILSTYDDQIAALENQQTAITDTASEYDALKAQLDALQRASERMDLEKSLNFDGLMRSIDQAAHSIQEMPFDEIMAGIAGAKSKIDEYTLALDAANSNVDDQQKLVDAAQKKVDALNKSYDAERDKLDAITKKYNEIKDAVDEVTQALSGMISAVKAANQAGVKKKKGGGGYTSNALDNFNQAAGGDFADVGGSSGLGREGGLADIQAFNAEMEGKIAKLGSDIDLFKPFREKWKSFTEWWDKTVVKGIPGLFHKVPKLEIGSDVGFTGDKENTKLMNGMQATVDGIVKIWNSDTLKSMGNGVIDVIKAIGAVLMLFWPELHDLGEMLWDTVIQAFKDWSPEIQRLGKALAAFWHSPVLPLIHILWALVEVIGILIGTIGVVLLGALKIVAATIVGALRPALDVAVKLIGDLLQVFSGLLTFLSGVFSLNFALMWQGIVDIVSGTFQAIWHIIDGVSKIILGAVWGFVSGVVGFFKWLWDVLVGHSIVPDMCNAIVDWFLGLPGRILGALATLGQKLVDLIVAAWNALQAALASAWLGTYNFIKGLPQKIYDGFMAYVGLLTSIGTKIVGFWLAGLTGAWSTVGDWIGGKVDWVVSKFGGIRDALANKFSGMFDGIKDAFRSAINFVINGWNSLSFGIPGFDPPGPGSFPGITVSVPHITPLAAGGTAMKNMPYVVGEVGPEFFVPGSTGRVVSNNAIGDLMNKSVADAFSMLQSAPLSATVKDLSPAALDAIAARANARAAAADQGAASIQPTVVNNHTELHFHGDLVFPNVQTGEDAETFITNLSDLAG